MVRRAPVKGLCDDRGFMTESQTSLVLRLFRNYTIKDFQGNSYILSIVLEVFNIS